MSAMSAGSRSRAAKHHLIERNLRLLNRLHPGYDALIDAFEARGPARAGAAADGCGALARQGAPAAAR